MLKEDGMFAFSHSFFQTCQLIQQTKMLQRAQTTALSSMINVYEVQTTSILRYLEAYDTHSKFLKQELFEMVDTDTEIMQARFIEVLSDSGSIMMKSILTRVDDVSYLAAPLTEERNDYLAHAPKLRHNIMSDMRSYKEILEREKAKTSGDTLQLSRV